ncbi:LOW QUALITY PROTEIN: G-protein coupled receptor family C group 6 member A [Hipposideros larvatus]
MALLIILMTCFLIFLATSQPCQTPDDFVAASFPGHIIIGGLFAIHETMLSSEDYPRRPEIQKCVGFEISIFLQTLAMIHSIEMIDNSGVKLEYKIHDTCTEVTVAIAAALRFLSKFNCSKEIVEFKCDYSRYMPRVKAVIGAGYSEISMAISRILNLQLTPQVNYESTAEIPSDKICFPSFLWTLPSEFYQIKVMAHLIQKSGWNWIGIITTDDDYGQLSLNTFAIHTAVSNVCIAFKEGSLSDNTIEVRINQTLEKIIAEAHVKIIVVFLRQFHVFNLFSKAIERNISKVCIASDNWSTATKITTIPDVKRIGKVIGFTFTKGNSSSFQSFLQNLDMFPSDNKPLNDYAMLLSACAHVEDSELSQRISNRSQGTLAYTANKDMERNFSLRNDFLWDYIETGFVHSIQLAVFAPGYALRDLCQVQDCQNPNAFQPWDILAHIENVTFTDGGNSFHFEAHGDMNTGYDIVPWKEISGHMNITKMAQYDFIITDQETKNEFRNLKLWICFLCNNERHWAPVRNTVCFEKGVEYLNKDAWAILLLTFSLLGILFVLTIGIIFTRNMNTPIVKSGGLTFCSMTLLCHFLNFASTGFFIGDKDFTHKTQKMLFGISFTLCISCILTKSLKILLAFRFDPKLQNVLKSLYKPIRIIFTCTGIQGVMCTLCLTFAAPAMEKNVFLPRVIFLPCKEGSILAFGTMLGYIAILAFICFIFAFKGRKLPENYNEAKFITFGMLIYFIAWITFIPIDATTFGKYLSAVEIIVILTSNYGILCCTFFPKCVILCKQETNTKSAFLKTIYSCSSCSADRLPTNHVSLDSTNSNITMANPSSGGKSAAWQKSKDLQPFSHICKENATNLSKTWPQKRISSI